MQPDRYRELGDAGWRWVLDQVRWDDGPWIPESSGGDRIPHERDNMYDGVAGLAYVLAEIRLARPWTREEAQLAEGIADRLRRGAATETDASYATGLASGIGALMALGAGGVDASLSRLLDLVTPGGWPQHFVGPPRVQPGAIINDVIGGTAGTLLGALFADGELADAAAGVAADLLLGEAQHMATGVNWRAVSPRWAMAEGPELPNFSHGTAGISTSVALAGHVLGRADLVDAAREAAEHLVTLGWSVGDGFVVPHYVPHGDSDEDEVTYTWCHGPTGTSLLFVALDLTGVGDIAGVPPLTWHRRLLASVRASGIPERLHPGFWDNDGRCCGTAGVGDVFLDSYQRAGDPADLEFAVVMADALVERAIVDGDRACWRFLEHRSPEPLLPPGVGWMQGAAGISAYLLRIARVLSEGVRAPTVARLDNWWAVPGTSRLSRRQPRE
jgi:lantibiotic modifying enzyme